jgi:hypothetical protein
MDELHTEVISEMEYPNKGKPCKHGKKTRFSLGCMQHEYKHVVGYACRRCSAQWFLEDDWRTDECRQYDQEKNSEKPLDNEKK